MVLLNPEEIREVLKSGVCNLSNRGLTVLPPEIGQLTSLHTLILGGNELKFLPPEIGQLTSLHTLRLGGNQLKFLPPEIGQLTTLRDLMLNSNQLATLPPEISRLINLQELTLSRNRLTKLPTEIGQLASLQVLRLDGNQLVTLPVEIADQLEHGLLLSTEHNPLAEPFPELLRQGAGAVAVYLRSLRDGIAQYEAKVLLVGEGNVGKTSLSAALRGKKFVEGRPFTHGIEIEPVVLSRPATGGDMVIRLWDFGGQEVYRITHQFFFTQRALYVVVWKPREGQEQNEVEGWLRRIRLRAGPDARVMIVATHCAAEQYPDLNYPHLEREFPGMLAGHFEVDNQTGRNIEGLRDAIAGEAARLPQMGQEISSRWAAVRKEIASLAVDQPQMSFQDYAVLCQRHQVEGAEVGTLAALMHDLGQIIYYGEDEGLQDFVVLNPEWLTKAISYVLRDEPTRDNGGVLDHARLREIWQDQSGRPDYPTRHHPYFLRLMEKFDISYRLEDEQRSLVAQMVPYQRPDLPWDSSAPLPGRLRRLALVCELSEPAPGLMAWLTVRHHQAATGRHWRTGVFLRHPIRAYASEALLELASPARLSVEVRAPSPDHYFHVLYDSIETLIESRWPGLTYQLLVPCPTIAVDGSRCSNFLLMDDLLAYREEGEARYLCSRCRTRHDLSSLLTGFSLPAQQAAENELQQHLGRVENRLARMESQAAYTAAVIRQVHRAVSTEVTDCPTLFTLAKNRHSTNKLQQVYQHRYLLTLWCEHPDHWHPWDKAEYQVNQSKEWLVRIGPYARLIAKTLQLVVPLAGSIAVASTPMDQIERAAARLEMMKTIVDALPVELGSEPAIAIPGEPSEQMTAAQGSALRALRVFIFEQDHSRRFGGLQRVQAPSGDLLWVCPSHYAEYDPGLPSLP